MTRAYEKKHENNLYSSGMEIVVRANEDKFREVKKMCQALRELFKEEFEEKLQRIWKRRWKKLNQYIIG